VDDTRRMQGRQAQPAGRRVVRQDASHRVREGVVGGQARQDVPATPRPDHAAVADRALDGVPRQPSGQVRPARTPAAPSERVLDPHRPSLPVAAPSVPGPSTGGGAAEPVATPFPDGVSWGSAVRGYPVGTLPGRR
jgi:hypothetical protein